MTFYFWRQFHNWLISSKYVHKWCNCIFSHLKSNNLIDSLFWLSYNWSVILTQWGQDSISPIFANNIFLNAFSWMKISLFYKFEFPWSLFLMVQLKIKQHWFFCWDFGENCLCFNRTVFFILINTRHESFIHFFFFFTTTTKYSKTTPRVCLKEIYCSVTDSRLWLVVQSETSTFLLREWVIKFNSLSRTAAS